jgi:hypothetical protein
LCGKFLLEMRQAIAPEAIHAAATFVLEPEMGSGAEQFYAV